MSCLCAKLKNLCPIPSFCARQGIRPDPVPLQLLPPADFVIKASEWGESQGDACKIIRNGSSSGSEQIRRAESNKHNSAAQC